MNLDLHVHSHYSSDALSKPGTILKVAEKKNLVVAITEHNSAKSWPIFKELAKSFSERAIFGQEIEAKKDGKTMGHFIGLFMYEEITARDYLEVIDEIKAQDALLMIAHPFDIFRTPCKCLNEIKGKIDLVESFNARSYFNSFNEKAHEFAVQNNIPMAAGSDAHIPEEIGYAKTFVRADTLEEARKELKKGNTQVTGKKSGLYPHFMTLLATLKLAKPR